MPAEAIKLQSCYTFNSDLGIYERPDKSAMEYSDGDQAENYLLSVFSNSNPSVGESGGFSTFIRDWPSEYHLSESRNNLLRAVDLKGIGNVLEIGAGCGALTPYLAKNCKNLVALEGSRRRAGIIAKRCGNFDNVRIFVDNFQEFDINEKFDLVTFVGVLEYAPAFVDRPDPVQWCVKRALEFLKPGGKLIIAIENKLGLKYFAGHPEDHLNKPFVGLMGLYEKKSPVTFGRLELKRLLQSCGLSEIEFFFPFPDYKLPRVVVSEIGLGHPDLNLADLLSGAVVAPESKWRRPTLTFCETAALGAVASNGLVADLANSFLVVAGRDKSDLIASPDWLAKSFAVDRPKSRSVETSFYSKSGKITVIKRLLETPSDNSVSELSHDLGQDNYVLGTLYSNELLRILLKGGGVQDIADWARPWVEYLKSQSDHSDILQAKLPGNFLDCVPFNLVVDQNSQFKFIDREWQLQRPVSLVWVLARGLVYSFLRMEYQGAISGRRIGQVVTEILQYFDINLLEHQLAEIFEVDVNFWKLLKPQDANFDFYSLRVLWNREFCSAADYPLILLGNGSPTEFASVDQVFDSMGNRKISIIIPVYNAFVDAQACILSILQTTTIECEVVVIDDASPEGDFGAHLAAAGIESDKIRVIRNAENLGFVASCNLGIELTRGHDVVLLNSDTIVTPGWLRKLRKTAYSSSDIGTVTPLTNNGDICSVPSDRVPKDLTNRKVLNSFAALVERSARHENILLPTCVGFCVFIKNAVIQKVGVLDSASFGVGYGEENDFSCRAQRVGYVDVLDDSTFIYHKGSQSFGEKKHALMKKNWQTLIGKHPFYEGNVQNFWLRRPIQPVFDRLQNEMLRQWLLRAKSRVLHIIHNGPTKSHYFPPGGTELHVQDLIAEMPEVAQWSLVCKGSALYLTAHYDGLEREFVLRNSPEVLDQLISQKYFDHVHVQHVLRFDLSLLVPCLRAHGNYSVSLHDYHLICPRLHLVTLKGVHCSGTECSSACGVTTQQITELRQSCAELMENAQCVIAFSESSKNYHAKILGSLYPKAGIKVIPHGIRPMDKVKLTSLHAEAPSQTRPFKVLFLGAISEMKGAQIIATVSQHSKLDTVPVEWHVLGEIDRKFAKNVIHQGRYNRHELSRHLREIAPDLVAILSICPETYCFTLDEALASGIPVLVTPLGAPPERVNRWRAGWVLKELTAAEVLRTIRTIVANWPGYLEVRRNLETVQLPGIRGEVESYFKLYPQTSRAIEPNEMFEFLEKSRLIQSASGTKFKQNLGKIFRRSLFVLDRLGVKSFFVRLAVRCLSDRTFNRLREIRFS